MSCSAQRCGPAGGPRCLLGGGGINQVSARRDPERTWPGVKATPPQPSPDRGVCAFLCCSKTTQRNKQIAMGRKKFNMDPKKVRICMGGGVINLGLD